MTDEREYDDLARELHAMRAEPRPEYARELDQRAAAWLRECPRRRFPSLRIAIPAVATAAAAVVIALVVSGGDEAASELQVAVVQDQGAAEALGAPLEQRDSAARAEGAFAVPVKRQLEEGDPVIVRYFFTAPVEGTVEFAGRESSVMIPAGAGRLEISTEGVPAGTHELEIALPQLPVSRKRIEIGG
jgi:hypothetical protein